MTKVFVYMVVLSLSLVYSNGQRRQSDWGSPRFGQRNFGDDRGIGRDMFGGYMPDEMDLDFGRGSRRGGIDRDGNWDLIQRERDRGVSQPRNPAQGQTPTPLRPPMGQNPMGQSPEMGQGEIPEDTDQMAVEQGKGLPGQSRFPISPGLDQGGQVPVQIPSQPPMTQAPGEMGEALAVGPQGQTGGARQSQPPIQGQSPTGPRPDLSGAGQGQSGTLTPQRPTSSQRPMLQPPNEVGQEQGVGLQGQIGGVGQNRPSTPSQPPTLPQGQPPMRQRPDEIGRNGGPIRGQSGQPGREETIPQQPTVRPNLNRRGQGEQTLLGGPRQTENPARNLNPLGQPQRPTTSVRGQGEQMPIGGPRQTEFSTANPSSLGQPQRGTTSVGGQGEQMPLGGSRQTKNPTLNTNPLRQPQTTTVVSGQTEPDGGSEFEDADIEELKERISRPPRG